MAWETPVRYKGDVVCPNRTKKMLWAGVLVVVDSMLGWILGMDFQWKDVAIIVGTSGIVFGAEWLFRKAEGIKV